MKNKLPSAMKEQLPSAMKEQLPSQHYQITFTVPEEVLKLLYEYEYGEPAPSIEHILKSNLVGCWGDIELQSDCIQASSPRRGASRGLASTDVGSSEEEQVQEDKTSISIEWSVSDIKAVVEGFEKSISDSDALVVLEYLEDNHNAEVGINWSLIEEVIHELSSDNSITLI